MRFWAILPIVGLFAFLATRPPPEVIYDATVPGTPAATPPNNADVAPAPLSQAAMGDDWPLTVPTATVGCADGRAWFVEAPDGTRAGLNGPGQTLFGTLQERGLWRQHEVAGTMIYVQNLRPLQDAAQASCD